MGAAIAVQVGTRHICFYALSSFIILSIIILSIRLSFPSYLNTVTAHFSFPMRFCKYSKASSHVPIESISLALSACRACMVCRLQFLRLHYASLFLCEAYCYLLKYCLPHTRCSSRLMLLNAPYIPPPGVSRYNSKPRVLQCSPFLDV